jgi:FkbM family methyltransferase
MQTRGDIYNELRSYLAKIVNPTIFEVGCHQGEDSHIIFNNCRGLVDYYAFEPLPANVVAIKSKLHIPPNIHFVLSELAISDKVGKAVFNVSGGTHPNGLENTMAGSLRNPKNVKTSFPFIDFNQTIEVKTTTIDEFSKNNAVVKIDFIWCDIQGCEYDMLVGAKDMLPNIGMMLLEYSDNELYEGEKGSSDIMALLGQNWVIVVKTEEDILVKNINYGQ